MPTEKFFFKANTMTSNSLTHFIKEIRALLLIVVVVQFSRALADFPTITVGTDQEHSVTPMQPLVNFTQVIVLPIVTTSQQYVSLKVRFECKASYPIEWIYNYNEEHAIYYTQNLQYSPIERFFNETDYTNPRAFKYDATLGISPHYNFKNSPERFTCRSVSNKSLFRTVESYYEVTNVGLGNTTTSKPTTTTNNYDQQHHEPWLNENLIIRLRNESNPDYGEGPFQTGLGNGSLACPAYLVVKEGEGSTLPEWRCESGSGRSDEELSMNFAYCHEGMACQNLFRTIKNQRSCVRTIANNASLFSSSKTTSFVSPQSFEPGTAYCSSNGSIVVAQLFFYSMPPTIDGAPQNITTTSTHSPVWSDGVNQRFAEYEDTTKSYNMHFQWNEVRGRDMIFMHRLKHGGSVVVNDRVDVTCRFSVYYFALGYRIGLMYSNNSMQLRPYNYGYYDQRSNAIVVRDIIPVVNKNLTHIFCLGPVWNSTEWANVSRSVNYKDPIAPKFKPNFEEVDTYTEAQVSLLCETGAMPAPNITWFRLMRDNSTPTSWEWGLGFHSYYDDLTRNTKLTIHRATFPRHGFYRCMAQNYAGSDIKYFKLNVHAKTDYGLESLHNGVLNTTFYVGETNRSLQRILVYKGEIKAQWWWKEPLTLNITSGIRTGDMWDFHNKIELQDAGTYIYEVITERGVRTTKFLVQVKRPVMPAFSSDHKTTIIYQGFTKKLESVAEFCPEVIGDPIPEITLRNEKTGQSFDLANLRTDTSIRHICTATSRIGSTSLAVNIKVKKPTPPYFKKAIERIRVNLNKTNSVTLNCDAEGDPKPSQISWYKNHNVLQDTEPEPELENTLSSFTIKVLTKYDQGKYICQASSDAGNAQKIFTIDIEEPAVVPITIPPTLKPTTATTVRVTTVPTVAVTEKIMSGDNSKYAALITTTVLLALITLIGFAVFTWKIFNQRRKIQSLIVKKGLNREDSPDNWYQLNSSSTANLQIPGNSL